MNIVRKHLGVKPATTAESREVAVQMEMVGRKLAELLNVDHIEREAYTPAEPAAQIVKMVWDYMDGTTPELEIRKTLLR